MLSPVEELFTRALGLEAPWQVVKLEFSESNKRLDIHLDFPKGSRFHCPVCDHTDVVAYDTEDKTWRHLDFFQHQAYLHCRVPRIDCPDCGVKTVELPWSRPGSGFTLLFEALIMALAQSMPVKSLSKLIDEHDTKIWRVIHHYVEEARSKEVFAETTQVGVDETSRKKGHNYVTLFVDLEESKVIYVTKGKDSSTITKFINDFRKHGGYPDSITDFCCDMSPAFIAGIDMNLPDAKITFDRFHVMKLMGEAVDQVRRSEQKEHIELKNSRYIWLKNPENLTKKQRFQYESLSELNLKTARAYQIRLNLRDFWDQPIETAEFYLKRWYFWATHSRLEPVIKAAKTIKRHWEGIVNFTKTKINNGILEGINSVIQAVRNRARGFSSVKYFIAMIYMIAGKLNFRLPT